METQLKFMNKTNKSKATSSANNMLLDFKNTELEQEKAKNEELRKHVEMLKKRVYSKNDFESQLKDLKIENEDLQAKLKVSEKIRKQQKNSIKELQSQVNRLRKDKPNTSQPKVPSSTKQSNPNKSMTKTKSRQMGLRDENTDTNLNDLKGKILECLFKHLS